MPFQFGVLRPDIARVTLRIFTRGHTGKHENHRPVRGLGNANPRTTETQEQECNQQAGSLHRFLINHNLNAVAGFYAFDPDLGRQEIDAMRHAMLTENC